MSKALQKRLRERALKVSDEDIATFPHTYDDISIVQELMVGATTNAQIAAAVGISETALKQRLLDPVRCAWIASQIDHAVASQLGQVHGSVFQAALRTGDHNKAAYLDKLYGKGPRPQIQKHQHLVGHIDLTGLTNEQLRKFIERERRELGDAIEVEVVEKTKEE
jgi:hypothetical protein